MVFYDIVDLVWQHLSGGHGLHGILKGALVVVALGFGLFKLLELWLTMHLFFWRQFLRPSKNLRERYGRWAAVTGATDGIGRGYAEELAKQGLNILLISRSQSKLDTVAAEIEHMHGVETKTFAIDLVEAGNKSCTAPEWSALKKTFESLDIGVLINNAGQSVFNYLHENKPSDVDNCVAINCASLVKCTYAILPCMLARGRGAIVNLSSVAGTPYATPMISLYGATKAFVDHFSKSLHDEYKDSGVDIQAVVPAYVSTNMTNNMRPSLDAPLAGTYTQAAVRHIGYEAHAVPWFKHAINRPLFQMPYMFFLPLIRIHLGKARARSLAKQAKAAN